MGTAVERGAEFGTATRDADDGQLLPDTAAPGDLEIPDRDPRPERSEWRAEQDLRAQKSMARWSLFMLIVTSVGVYFVYRTLRAATAANFGFAVATQHQLTAYVIAEAFDLIVERRPKDKLKIVLEFTLRNAGQTPAFNVVHQWKCGWATMADADKWQFSDLPKSGAVMGPGRFQKAMKELRVQDEGAPQPNLFKDTDIAIHLAQDETIYVRGVATYGDVAGRTWRHDYFWVLSNPLEAPLPRGKRPKMQTIALAPHTHGNELKVIGWPPA